MIIIAILYLIILPWTIECTDSDDDADKLPDFFAAADKKKIYNIAKTHELINGLKLLGDKPIAISSTAIVWKGNYNKEDIAVKFIPRQNLFFISNKRNNHLRMNAFHNSTAESFGIPDMKYFWEIFNGRIFVIGLTLLETSAEKFNMKDWTHGQAISKPEATNILLFMKFAVIPMKQAHSVRLKHNNLTPNCFFIRGSQVFVADWDCGEIGDADSGLLTRQWASRDGIACKPRSYKDDIETLFNVFQTLAKINSTWEGILNYKQALDKRNDFKAMRAHCDQIGHNVLRKYCKKFFNMAYNCPKYLNYNELFHFPDKFIEEITGSKEPIYFSWLKDKELDDAKKINWIRLLNDIPDPPRDDSTKTTSGLHDARPVSRGSLVTQSNNDASPTSPASTESAASKTVSPIIPDPASERDKSVLDNTISHSTAKSCARDPFRKRCKQTCDNYEFQVQLNKL